MGNNNCADRITKEYKRFYTSKKDFSTDKLMYLMCESAKEMCNRKESSDCNNACCMRCDTDKIYKLAIAYFNNHYDITDADVNDALEYELQIEPVDYLVNGMKFEELLLCVKDCVSCLECDIHYYDGMYMCCNCELGELCEYIEDFAFSIDFCKEYYDLWG